MPESQSSNPTARALCLIPRCKTLRVGAGMKMRELAEAAGVSVDTVRNVERHKPVSEVYAARILNALRMRIGEALRAEEYIERTRG